MSRCQIYWNGQRIKEAPPQDAVLWAGQFSVAGVNGAIIKFVQACLQKAQNNLLVVIPLCDGDTHSRQIKELQISSFLENISHNKKIIGTLCQRTEDHLFHYLYLPLDDDFFQYGVSHFFSSDMLPSWDQRKPQAFWRGGCSGGGMEGVRCRTVGALLDCSYADVKCITRWGWAEGKNIPAEYFGNEVHYIEYMNYKYILIIDGNVIASSHMWTFATGAVPVMISNAHCWFSRFLVPYENYVPVNYDLSNLRETLEWLETHDTEAKKIAENALSFSRHYFSKEFQQQYLETEIKRLCTD